MTKLGDTKWDREELPNKKHVSHADKQAIAEYYQAGLKTGRSSEDLLAELADQYNRSSRQIQRYIAEVAAGEAGFKQKPYEETHHKQKMRELARKLMQEIKLLPILNSFFIDLNVKRYFRHELSLVINEGQEITVKLPIEEEENMTHLYKGLLSHLQTSNFSKIVDDIDTWKEKMANFLQNCNRLFTQVNKELETNYHISIPVGDKGKQLGFTPGFTITICADAIEHARGAVYITDDWYRCEGVKLICGAYTIYRGSPEESDEKLKHYESVHKKMRVECAKRKLTKEITEQSDELNNITTRIKQELGKFADTERIPGHCALCG